MDVNPLCIILVKSDSKGDRLLFRYPFHQQETKEPANTKRRNPYTLPNVEDLLQSPPQPLSNIQKGQLTGFSDAVLSSLFAVKPELCNRKFELKVNDVRFVSHPTLLQLRDRQQDASGMMLINVVFALQALAVHSVVRCYHDLSKRVGVALRHEEKRCGYVSEQTQIMTAIHEDGYSHQTENAFKSILEKCNLAKTFSKMYEDLSSTGLVNVRINRWIPLTFCLPQKVHQWHLRGRMIEPDDIDRCLKALRPYHSLLLLHTVQQMGDFVPLDGAPTLLRLFSQYSPLKNLQTLAADCDLTLNHVFELTAHLVYWAKATVIFPVCSTNKYVIATDAPVHINSPLVDKFVEAFPGANLVKSISEFSLPTSLGQINNPLYPQSSQLQMLKMVIWMLQHHLLCQLHTYIQYIPTDSGEIRYKGRNRMVNPLSPSHRNSTILSGSYQPSISEHSRAESESGNSTISETPDRPDFDSLTRNTIYEHGTGFDDPKHGCYQEELLLDFPDEERGNIFKIPATNNPEDLALFARLCRKGYFHGEHHIEDIMYLENLRRSQVLQLLDKFRDILITYETEDPAIAMFSYPS